MDKVPHDSHTEGYSIQEQIRYKAGVWVILGDISATQTVAGMKAEGMSHHWTALFFATMAGWLVFAFAAPLAAQPVPTARHN